MAERPAEITALTVLVIAEIPNFWSGFLPSLFTIATFSKGDAEKMEHTRHWIRRGEVQAIGLSIALGIGASLLASEPWPFVGTLAMVAYLLYQYEHALKVGQDSGLGLDMDHPEQAPAPVGPTLNRWTRA
jgi:hypothetical protein